MKACSDRGDQPAEYVAKVDRTVGRIVRFHAETDTLDDTSFEAAVGSLQEDVARLEQERERLLSALPGGRLEADEKVLGQIGAEFLDRLEKLTFTVKRQVFAMLDVHVQMEPTGQIVASLAIPRPVEADQRKVLKRTFFQECSFSYSVHRYTVKVPGPEDGSLIFHLSLDRASWSRQHPACTSCGQTALPHQAHGLCARCYARAYSRRRYVAPPA